MVKKTFVNSRTTTNKTFHVSITGFGRDTGRVKVAEHSLILAVCECMSFAKSWQEKGCSSQAETSRVKNILVKDFDGQVKFDVFVVSLAK